MTNNIFVGLHLHKAAGTTLQIHFEQNLRSHLTVTSPIVNYQYGRVFFDELPKSAVPKKKVIWGHDVKESMLYGIQRDYFLFTFLREPVGRIISWYKYEQRKRNLTQTFKTFVELRSNFMCKMIIEAFPSLDTSNSEGFADKASSILDKFNFIGTQENFSEHSKILLGYMGIPPIEEGFRANVNPESSASDDEINFAKEFNQEDIKLFERIFKGVPSECIINDSQNAASLIRGKKASYSDSILKRLINELSDLAHHGKLKERHANDQAVILRRLCSMYLTGDESQKVIAKRLIFIFQRESDIKINFNQLDRLSESLRAKDVIL